MILKLDGEKKKKKGDESRNREMEKEDLVALIKEIVRTTVQRNMNLIKTE